MCIMWQTEDEFLIWYTETELVAMDDVILTVKPATKIVKQYAISFQYNRQSLIEAVFPRESVPREFRIP